MSVCLLPTHKLHNQRLNSFKLIIVYLLQTNCLAVMVTCKIEKNNVLGWRGKACTSEREVSDSVLHNNILTIESSFVSFV